MRETEINQKVIDFFAQYKQIKAAFKHVHPGGFSFERAKTHPDNQIGNAIVLSAELADDCRLNVDINTERTKSFRFRLFCDNFMKRPCYRFESDGPAHEAPPADDRPLPKRSVPTPHFHRYDEEGRNVPYRTDELVSGEEEFLRDVQRAFVLFCKEENIDLRSLPDLVYERSIFEKNELVDPMEGVTLP